MILDALHSYRLRAFPNLGSPVMATPEVVGATGSTVYTYVATITTINGETIPSEAKVVSNGYATLDETHQIKLSLVAVSSATWTINFYKLVSGSYYLLGSCTAVENELYDEGQEWDDAVSPPSTDTSGRDEWRFVGIVPGRLGQRIEMIDLQGIYHKALKDLGDTIYKNGDLVSEGCKFTPAVGGFVDASLIGPYNVDGKKIKLGFQGAATFEVTLSGVDVSASTVATQIMNAVNGEVEQVTCSSVNNGYLRIAGAGIRTLVLYDMGELVDDAYDALGITPAIYPPLTWNVTEGDVYIDGLVLRAPAGQVTVTGSGIENVGVSLDFDVLTYEDDPKLRNIDEDLPPELETYNLPGADRVTVSVAWCTDEDGMVVVQKFENGKPMTTTQTSIQSDIDERIAQATYDVSGSFVVDNFKIVVDDHSTDSSKLVLQMGPGKAYPGGYKKKIDETKSYVVDKARDVTSIVNGTLEPYSAPGGYVLASASESYNVDGLKVNLQIDSGSPHETTLTGTTESAQDVADQINAAMNAIPTSSDLTCCDDVLGKLQIQAEDGKTLTVLSVAGDAYTILGISTGVYYPIGTRIYEFNNDYVRDVSSLSYITEIVENVSHDSGTHKDLLAHAEVSDILGASDALVDAHDEKWDYVDGVDFVKNGDYVDFSGMSGNYPSGTYYVKYRYSRTATKGTRQLCEVKNVQITRGAGNTDELTFTNYTTCKRVLSPYADVTPTGTPKDIQALISVSSSPDGGGTLYSQYTYIPNSDALKHDTSYLDWSGATIKPAFENVYYATFRYWYHPVEGDFVTADSYDSYASIGMAPNDLFYLRDCADFRTVAGARPVPGDSPDVGYAYYLPRRDKVILRENGEFIVARGIPSLIAPVPNDIERQLTLAVLYYPPYTYTKQDVIVITVEPVRITQVGLKNMEKRIERLEYWNAVNGLEKEATNRVVTYDSKGLFTDALTGWSRQDLSYVSQDGTIRNDVALDRYLRILQLPPDPDHDDDVILELDLDTPGVTDGVVQLKDGLILDYDPEVFDSQLQASMWMNCAPDYELTNFYGSMEIFPTTALFLDKEQLPALKADFDNNLNSALTDIAANMYHPLNWGEWREDSYSLVMYNNYTSDETITYSREGTQNQVSVLPGAKTINLGDRVVDMSMTPMVQTKNPEDGSPFVVQLDIKNLLPNQDHSCMVAGKPVSLVYDSAPQSGVAFGSAGTNTYLGLTTAKVNNDGRLTAKFTMPSGVEAGAIPICVFYYADSSISNATSSMYSSGFTQKNQTTVLGYESPEVRVVPTAYTETRTDYHSITGIGPGAGDPIAQTFLIKNDGTYVSAVDLYFKERHTSLGITVYIKDVVNGKPGNHIYASKYLRYDQVNISTLGTNYTRFTFPEVLYYKPSEWFCLVVRPELNNTGYQIMVAEKSQIDLATGARIVQPHDGVLFHSPNLDSWQEMTNRDLKFKLYKSNFVDQAAIQWKEVTGFQASRFIAKVDEVVTGDTRIRWYYSIDSGVTWESYYPKIDVDLQAITQKITLRADVTTLGGSYQIYGNTGIKVRLHNTSANYVTNTDFFTDPLTQPNTIFAFADIDAASVNGSGETDITPYYSVDGGVTWTELPKRVGYEPLITQDPFRRYEWELASPISTFSSIKGRLKFSTTNASKTPRVWNGVSFICSKE